MRIAKNLILCMLLLAMTSTAALAVENTMAFEFDWFDLETGTVIPVDPFWDPTSACDFKFTYHSHREPHAVIFQNVFQNEKQGVEIAYSEEDYADVTFSDMATLVFTPSLIDIPFDKVAVLLTTEGNYFKVGPISENPDFTVTFEWEQLTPSPADLVQDLAQAVADLVLPKGVENGLNAKLDAAYKKLTDDNDKNDTAAINQLEAFINEVEAQRGKKIPEADADALIAQAQEIIDLLEAG